jgi:integrase/recombinase XerD
MSSLDTFFTQFVRERIYLNNVTPATREWYETAWKAFSRFQQTEPPRPPAAPLITRNDLQRFVVHLRERGVKPVSCNCWLKGINAFCGWLHSQGVLAEPLRLRPQKLEKRLLRLHDQSAIRAMLHYKPKDYTHWRVHTMVCTILDTGCRINELLTARVADFDMDNLLLTVNGKGRKERKVPFSTELRKAVFRFNQVRERTGVRSELMFPARNGGKWGKRNALRSYYCLLQRLHLPQSGFHMLRHTFATEYLRSGGDVVRLSIVLGHSDVSTTMKYLHLLTEDLQRPHQTLSILNRLR